MRGLSGAPVPLATVCGGGEDAGGGVLIPRPPLKPPSQTTEPETLA